jgi:hypothetical protein
LNNRFGLKGKDQDITFKKTQPNGTPEFEETKVNHLSTMQFQKKAGFFFSIKKKD